MHRGVTARTTAMSRFPLRWPGNKRREIDHVDAVAIDWADVDVVVEPFAGSAALSLELAVRHPHMRFVLGDTDAQLIEFWRMLARPGGRRASDRERPPKAGRRLWSLRRLRVFRGRARLRRRLRIVEGQRVEGKLLLDHGRRAHAHQLPELALGGRHVGLCEGGRFLQLA